MGLNSVLDEEVMASNAIANVILHCKVMDSVDGDHSRQGIMDCISPDVGSRDVAHHVEVDAISTKDGRLPALGELGVCNVSLGSVHGLTHDH